MKTKRLLASLLAVTLSFSTFAACGGSSENDVDNTTEAVTGDNDTDADTDVDADDAADADDAEDAEPAGSEGYEIPDFKELYGDEPVELTIFSQLANYSGKMTGWFAKILEEKFNCTVTIIPDTNGALDTRMESGNLGDIVIFGSDGDQYKRAVELGMLFDWEEDDILDEYGPYIKDNMQKALEKNAGISEEVTGESTIYGFGHNVASNANDHESFFYTWDIRYDLYQQLGCPEVKDLDDYYDLLVKMKEICPTDENGNPTYAVSLWPDWDGSMVMYVKAFATAYWGYDELEMGLYDVETGDFHFCLEENGPYLESLKFFNKLYQADLIDPNSMTQTYNEVTEKVVNGGTFFSIFNYAGSQLYNTEEHIAENKMMLALTPDEATPICYGMNVNGSNRLWTIGANTEYPELCMAIINYLSTPEGYMTYKYGPEDLCWYYDEDGYTHFTELGEQCYTLPSETMMPSEWGGGTFRDGQLATNNTTWSIDATNPDSNGETYNPENWASRQEKARCDLEQQWRDSTSCITSDQYLNSKDYKVSIGGTTYTASTQSDDLKLILTQVKENVVTNTWKAMYAKTDEEFDAIVAEMITKHNEYDPEGVVLAWGEEQASIRRAAEEAVIN